MWYVQRRFPVPLSFNPVWHLYHREGKLFSEPFLVKCCQVVGIGIFASHLLLRVQSILVLQCERRLLQLVFSSPFCFADMNLVTSSTTWSIQILYLLLLSGFDWLLILNLRWKKNWLPSTLKILEFYPLKGAYLLLLGSAHKNRKTTCVCWWFALCFSPIARFLYSNIWQVSSKNVVLFS